jgi:hypothetical protein
MSVNLHELSSTCAIIFMALNATVCKAELHIADMDRQYYQQHNLTLAQHPSETDERLMLRLLAFALHASEWLALTKGLSSEDEPDIWQKNLTGEIDVWIDLGLPTDKRIRKACGRAKQVFIYTYGRGSADMWWKNTKPLISRFDNLTILHIAPDISQALAKCAAKNVEVSVSVQDTEISWHCNGDSVIFTPEVLLASASM